VNNSFFEGTPSHKLPCQGLTLFRGVANYHAAAMFQGGKLRL